MIVAALSDVPRCIWFVTGGPLVIFQLQLPRQCAMQTPLARRTHPTQIAAYYELCGRRDIDLFSPLIWIESDAARSSSPAPSLHSSTIGEAKKPTKVPYIQLSAAEPLAWCRSRAAVKNAPICKPHPPQDWPPNRSRSFPQASQASQARGCRELDRDLQWSVPRRRPLTGSLHDTPM